MKSLIALVGAGLSPLALAHDGHGLSGAHWHATDTLGFVVLAAIVGVALWATRRK
ncbi:MAG TPA: hypothetical protein VFU71_10805 [Burkholderiaceae bacterium]|nr:hypothetical protein [Burkholderiaceae bacterium]